MDVDQVTEVIKRHKPNFSPIVSDLKREDLIYLDFSEQSPYLQNIDLKDTIAFDQLIFQEVLKEKTGIGGYFENRIIYRRSAHFSGEEARSLHLGVDIWIKAGTPLYTPLEGKIHSLQDNQGFGNYGPTIIVEHQLKGATFYVLYGHLDRESLQDRRAGDWLAAGQLLGRVGNFPENGDWPPHLHWQVMTDMLGQSGDFPGVAKPSNREFYLQYCIDPHYLLVLD